MSRVFSPKCPMCQRRSRRIDPSDFARQRNCTGRSFRFLRLLCFCDGCHITFTVSRFTHVVALLFRPTKFFCSKVELERYLSDRKESAESMRAFVAAYPVNHRRPSSTNASTNVIVLPSEFSPMKTGSQPNSRVQVKMQMPQDFAVDVEITIAPKK